MMNKTQRIIYYVATILFSLMLLGGAITYFVNYDMVSEMFKSLGVPAMVIYPLAVLKIIGVVAILFIKNKTIKSLAYLGFFLDLVLAIGAHLLAGDGNFFGPIIPLLLLIVSFLLYRKKQA